MLGDAFKHRLRRGTFDVKDLLLVVLVLSALVAVFLPSLSRGPRPASRNAACASNLRGIAQGMHIYANENLEWFPIHYSAAALDPSTTPLSAGVRWVGSMGSNDFLKISECTSPQKSPDRSHPSRSLFLLIAGGFCVPLQFTCPMTDERDDELHNYGPDTVAGGSQPARPGRDRFDFSGYSTLSYGYQLPYANAARPSRKLDPRMPIAADKGPYYALGGDGLADSKTTRDTRNELEPPMAWSVLEAKLILARPKSEWRAFNSRNHAGEDQNVVFVDGHAERFSTPLAGIDGDNLYTLATSAADVVSSLIGFVPAADETFGPLTSTDAFIVP